MGRAVSHPTQVCCPTCSCPCIRFCLARMHGCQFSRNPADLKTGPAGRTLFQVPPESSPAAARQALS